jgi:hypothetical protein
MEGARRWGNDDDGFSSWRLGMGLEHSMEKSSGARERRNHRLGSSVTKAGQRRETTITREWWRDRTEVAWASQKKTVCFASSLGRNKDKDGR